VKQIFFVWVLILVVFLSGCGGSKILKDTAAEKKDADQANIGYLVHYDEIDRDGQSFQSRLFVTRDFLRMDDGPEAEDYLVFDYVRGIIYNVVAEDQSVKRIDKLTIEYQLDKPAWTIRTSSSRAVVPQMNTNTPAAEHHEFFLDGKSCFNVISVQAQMNEITTRLQAYREVLANSLAGQYQREGKFEDQCHQSIHVLDPLVRFKHGFPIREWSITGEQRFVQNIKRGVNIDSALFQIPEAYQQY